MADKITFGITNESFKLCHGAEHLRNDYDIYGCNKVELSAPRRSDAGFQAVVLPSKSGMFTVDTAASFSRFGDWDTIRIAVDFVFDVELFPVGTVTDDDFMQKGDILLTTPEVEMTANIPVSVFGKITVPADAVPGEYSGKLCIFHSSLFSKEELIGELFFTLTVFDYIMPKPAHWKHHLDLWQHPSNIARKAEVKLWSDDHFRVLRPYLNSLAEIGQKSITIIAGDVPWVGQNCFLDKRNPSDLFEYNMIKVYEDKNGTLSADYSAMDKYINLCRECGFSENAEIEVFGLFSSWENPDHGFGPLSTEYADTLRVRVQRSDGTLDYLRQRRDLEWYVKSFANHCKEKGWNDRLLITVDEPSDPDLFRTSLTKMKELAPELNYKAAINHVDFIDAFGKEINSFVPYLGCYLEKRGVIHAYKAKYPNKQFLWYVCCGPSYPNTFIGSNLLEARALAYITMSENLDGFLRWNYTVWPHKPREDMRYPNFRCGDLNFVYPAGDARPLLSLRYMALKRGIEEYEMMKELKERGKSEIVEQALNHILVNRPVTYEASVAEMLSLSHKDYEDTRKLLLSALS